MTRLSIAPKATDDVHIADCVERYARRIEATAPGVCPLAIELSLLRASAAQTCGKCVPCRDGLPHLADMLEHLVKCESSEQELQVCKNLAEMIRATSDCAIGYEAANAVLEGLDTFAKEAQSHITYHRCKEGVGQTVPCETHCPAHVDIPGYISLAEVGDFAGAVNLIRKDNPLPTACGYVCEHPCEKRCRRKLIDSAINIRVIKKYIVDQQRVDKVKTPPRSADTGRRVAVIGGGPCGLTCAYFLALMGHHVVLYESHAQLGGMLRYGIPAYRFPRERLDEDIRGILSVGNIEVKYQTAIDTESMQDIASTFDAVFVAIGAQAGKTLSLEGSDAKGVISAVDLLGDIGDNKYPDFTGERVAVIGGGNVAMDCARTALRSGAKEVSVIYRRRKEDMTALASEVEAAMAEGIEFIMLQAPLSIEVDETGHCCALHTQPQMIGPVSHGRPAPLNASKPPERLEVDKVLMAVGQDIVSEPFSDYGMKTTRGRFDADDHLKAVGFDNVFVGGDCYSGPATMIKGIGAGKVAARNIDDYLGYSHKLDCGVVVPPPPPNDRTPMGRVEILERPARVRRHDFLGVETELSHEEAQQECRRCLRCDHFGCGVMEGGREQYA